MDFKNDIRTQPRFKVGQNVEFLLFFPGTFGRIYHGVLIGEDENDIESEQDVFIKTVTGWFFLLYYAH